MWTTLANRAGSYRVAREGAPSMQDLTPDGRKAVDDLAQRYGVSSDAVSTLLRALVAGNGTMAQFSHPDLGGMGQWSQGGMIMVGDMFNQGLKARVDGLCSELAGLLRGQQSMFAPAPSFQSQSQSSSGGQGGTSLFVQSPGSMFSNWWPNDLGSPSATGAQNNIRYAWFPATRRLAIDVGGGVSVYDTLDHQIGGFSQQQGPDASLTFTSQRGLVRVADLPLVSGAAAPAQPAPEPVPPPVASYTPEPVAPPPPVAEPVAPPPPAMEPAPQEASSAPPPTTAPQGGSMEDILSKIERLADLRQKGILTDEEFAAKKSELLSRL